MSGRLVAAMMTTPSAGSKPSISLSIWLSVCSRSSCPPPRPAPRLRPMESISSTKMMAGACLRAVWNRSRTRLAPTPTNISMKSEPLTERKGTPASPATARASRVLPVPGGPTSSTPLGIFAPISLKRAGVLRKSTTSLISCLTPPYPATSSKVVDGRSALKSRALERPMDMIPDICPRACRLMKIMRTMPMPRKRM
jgi:hypothetical protein